VLRFNSKKIWCEYFRKLHYKSKNPYC
jgi:hypothetical protein